ncbi:MAG: M20/M25/M40 family metallo-hydrolase [Syntrophobacteraceae bacterium]
MLPAEHPEKLRNLLRNLINIYSPTGKEQEIVGFLHGYLKSAGLPVELQKIDGGRANLIVIPPKTEMTAVLVGHLDTVAAYDLEEFGCREDQDVIEGLGAADMKGGCAALIEAYIAVSRVKQCRPPVALALVAGEEEDGDGARMLVKHYHFPWALIAEPTDMRPCFRHFGYFEIQITTTGKRMHASLANPGQGPVEAMLRLILRISRHIAEKRPDLVYNIRDLSSSRSGFAVPERCDAWLDIHLPPSAPLGEIIMEIEEILVNGRRESPDFNGALSFSNVHAGYELPEKGRFAEVLKRVYAERRLPWEPQDFRSHSDANLLWAAGTKPIILGPGSLEQAHSPDESVSFEQVLLASKVYHDLIASLCD